MTKTAQVSYTWYVGECSIGLNIGIIVLILMQFEYVYRMGWLSNAKVLIEQKNVDPNCSNGHGETALHEACR